MELSGARDGSDPYQLILRDTVPGRSNLAGTVRRQRRGGGDGQVTIQFCLTPGFVDRRSPR
jgi:hypothetical protein